MKLFVALITSVLTTGLSPALFAVDFDACLVSLQQRARAQGIEERIVEQVIPALEQQRRVLELDKKQPEFVKTFAQYLNARVTPKRVERGRDLYAQHREFLDQLTLRYGVPGQYLVSFWGLETNYGSYLGGKPTLDSLATLACDERRSEFFSNEFINALQLMQRESLSPEQMQGSWAGAVGHTQFMPSSYLRYAVDGDGDGHINLWQSERDALASGANFLQQLGWETGLRWGREVRLSKDFPYQRIGAEAKLSLAEWSKLGARRADGEVLPRVDIQGAILVPAGQHGPAFLVYDNFSVIMKWNRSESYALSVGYLADRISGAGTLRQAPPEGQSPLSREQTKEMQRRLNAAGYEAGAADGIFGPASRAALRSFQHAVGLVADGYPDKTSLARLQELESQPQIN